MISVIIVTYNNRAATMACLASLYAHHTQGGFEVVLVDNASADDTLAMVRRDFPHVRVLPQTENLGFARANNIGARAAAGDLLMLLNNDTVMHGPVLDELAAVLRSDARASAAAPRLTNPDGSFQLSYGFIPSIAGEWRTKRMQRDAAMGRGKEQAAEGWTSPEWVTAAALMVRADAFAAVGGFDERFFMYFEDVDLCIRLRSQCGPLIYEPSVSVEHIGGASWKKEADRAVAVRLAYRRSQLLLYAKHHGACQNALLRLYLALKFGARLLGGKDVHAGAMLRLAMTSRRAVLSDAERRLR